MTTREIDLRDSVRCFSCVTVVALQELYDGWDIGRAQDECPRCAGPLLPPLVPSCR